MNCGIVIVTYNSADVIGACLKHCPELPIIVVDNASSDDTVERCAARPHVRVIANSENRGFAAAVNQGVEALDSQFVLLLNPDVELQTGIGPLLEACAQPGTGLAAGQLLDPGGAVQAGFTIRRLPTPMTLAFEVLGVNRLFPWNPVNRRYRCLDLNLEHPAKVEQPAGAFLMFRREVWAKLGGFDPGFHPVWFEDVDFCRRALDSGWKIQYLPQVRATHRGAHSIRQMEWSSRERYWYASLLRYASKHFHQSAFRGVSAAVVLGSAIRGLIGAVRMRKKE